MKQADMFLDIKFRRSYEKKQIGEHFDSILQEHGFYYKDDPSEKNRVCYERIKNGVQQYISMSPENRRDAMDCSRNANFNTHYADAGNNYFDYIKNEPDYEEVIEYLNTKIFPKMEEALYAPTSTLQMQYQLRDNYKEIAQQFYEQVGKPNSINEMIELFEKRLREVQEYTRREILDFSAVYIDYMIEHYNMHLNDETKGWCDCELELFNENYNSIITFLIECYIRKKDLDSLHYGRSTFILLDSGKKMLDMSGKHYYE